MINSNSYIWIPTQFYCLDSQGIAYQCDEQTACSTTFFTQDTSISLITQNKLYCDKRGVTALSQGLIFAVGGVLCFLVTSLADKFGRKPVIQLSHILGFLGTFLLVFRNSFILQLFGLIIVNAQGFAYFNVMNTYINETMTDSVRTSLKGIQGSLYQVAAYI